MAALTDTKEINEKASRMINYPVAAGVKIFRGALVKITPGGFLAPCAAEAGAAFAGVSSETVDNTDGANGDVDCDVFTEGLHQITGSGFTQGSLKASVYASDDQTISDTQGANEQLVGKVEGFISATEVYVRLEV
jgi:hypothetical protein